MSTKLPEFRRGAVEPITCLRAGWQLIREQYWLFLGITVLGLLIGNSAPFGILLGPMMCGIYLCLFGRQRGNPVRFEMLFKGFDHFRESLIATLIQLAPVFILSLLTQVVFVILMLRMNLAAEPSDGSLPPAAFFASFGTMMTLVFVAVLLILLVTVFFVFSYPLIVDRELSGIDAVTTSFRAVAGNLGGVMGLLLLQLVLGALGVLLCYVGAFLFMPIGFAAWAIAYQQVFK